MGSITGGLTVLITFIGFSSPIIAVGLIYYLTKRLEHKQIIAAIEKGTSLSELRPTRPARPDWIKNLTAAIALLIIAFGVICIQLVYGWGFYNGELTEDGAIAGFIALVLFALGISRLIRGLLQRKTQKQIPEDNCKGKNTF